MRGTHRLGLIISCSFSAKMIMIFRFCEETLTLLLWLIWLLLCFWSLYVNGNDEADDEVVGNLLAE